MTTLTACHKVSRIFLHISPECYIHFDENKKAKVRFMTLDYSTEKIGKSNNLFEGSCEQSVDCDISLPDYCPDISRLLRCCVSPGISTSKISGDRACADGNAVVRVIYADEDNNICSYDQNYPFSKSITLKADISGTLETSVSVQYTNCRAVNKRRIEVHALLNICFDISEIQGCEIINSINRNTIQLKKKKIAFSDLSCFQNKTFSLGETVELPSDLPPAERIISFCIVPIVSDLRVVQDKILIKGEACATFVYCADNNRSECIRFNHSVAINQIVDIPGIAENSLPVVRLKVAESNCCIRNDANSIPRLLEINCNLIATVKAYRETETDCIIDAYCTDGQLQSEYEHWDFKRICEKLNETRVQNFAVDLSSLNVEKICCFWWDIPRVNKNLHNGNLSLHASIPLNIIAKDSDEKVIFCEREIDFEFKKTIGISECMVSDFEISPIGFSLGTIADGKAEIKGEFLIEAVISECHSISLLTGCDISPLKSRTASCIIIYFPDKEESLWNIARKFNTTVDMIKNRNSLSSDSAEIGTPLLIPVTGN